MRVNVYHEELTGEFQVKEVEPQAGNRFIGLRCMLKSAPELHNTPTDDDRSAVTFWFGDKLTAERYLTAALHAIKQS